MCCTESYCTCWDKVYNMRHQERNSFHGISDGIPQHQKGCLLYVPSTRKIISSYDVVFDEIFSIGLVYISQPYAETMVVCPIVSYTPYAIYSRGKHGDIITFTHFEEGDLLSETQT